MTRTTFVLLAVLVANFCNSQEYYGIINDPDGYTNVRKGPGTNHEIVAEALDNEIFYIEESSGDWFLVYLIENDYTKGYMHSSRVKRLSGLKSIGTRSFNSGVLTIKNEDFKFLIRRADFAKSKHEYELQDEKWVIKIDGLRPYGVDGGYPKTRISRFEFWENGTLAKTPTSAHSDLYEINYGAISIVQNNDKTVFITMAYNSDGAGAYDAVWVYKNGKYLKRVIIVP